MGHAWRSCMDGFTRFCFGAGHLRKRHNVSSKERSAGTQAVACQALWVIYDRCHTWIRSSAMIMAEKARRLRTGRQRYIAYRLISAKPQRCTLHQKNVAPNTFHSRQPRPPRIQKAGRKAAPKQRPPGGPKNKTAKEYYFRKREVAKTDPKMRPPRGPIFVTVQSKI